MCSILYPPFLFFSRLSFNGHCLVPEIEREETKIKNELKKLAAKGETSVWTSFYSFWFAAL